MERKFFKYIIALIFGCVSNVELSERDSPMCYNVNETQICYQIEDATPRNWFVAYKTCKEKNSALPIIRSVDEQSALQMYMTSLKSSLRITSLWTSGQNKKHDWTWINGQKLSNDMQFRVGDYNATYAILTYNFSLLQKVFQHSAPYICQYHGSECQQGNIIPLTNSCALLGEYYESWPEARRDCTSSGGDLAVLTKEDIQILKEHTAQHSDHMTEEILNGYGYWIGLRAESWFWITDDEKKPEEVTYTKWSDKWFLPSDSQCIYTEASTGTWKASACLREMSSVVCERRSASTIFIGQSTAYTTAILVTVAVIIGVLCGVIAVLVIQRRRREKACNDPQHRMYYQSLQANEAT